MSQYVYAIENRCDRKCASVHPSPTPSNSQPSSSSQPSSGQPPSSNQPPSNQPLTLVQRATIQANIHAVTGGRAAAIGYTVASDTH